MFYVVLEFLLQLSMVYLLVAMFILIDLLLWAVRARRFQEARDRREAERQRHEDRRERRKLGERPAIPSRAAQPVASLASVKISRNAEKTGFGRRASL